MEFSPEGSLKYLIVTFIWVECLWRIFLSLRQIQVYKKSTKIPSELGDALDKFTFNDAREYGFDKLYYEIMKDIVSSAVSTGFVALGWMSALWKFAEILTVLLGLTLDHQITISCFFIFQRNLITTIIDTLVNAYYTFVIEETHGFNKQTPEFYMIDRLKKFAAFQLFIIPLSAVGVFIVQRGGNMFILWMWLSAGVIMLLVVTIYPAFIAPMFDKFSPLREGPLRESIEKLAASLKFPLGQLYVVEGSKRSSHSNAYFYGLFGTRRIVLYDTLLEDYVNQHKGEPCELNCGNLCKDVHKKQGCKDSEVLAVLAHELGHWNHCHIYINLIATQLNLFLMFSAFGLMFNSSLLYEALGFPAGQRPIIVGLVAILLLVLSPYNAILDFAMTILSRKMEFQADQFAAGLGHADNLKKALIKLNVDNLAFPYCDPLYSAWHHSHPTILQRLQKLAEKKED